MKTFKRGQRIVWQGHMGGLLGGNYVMKSSAEGYIVVDMGGKYGKAQVVDVDSIVSVGKVEK